MSRPNSKASEDLAKVGDTILDPNGRNFSLHNKFNFNSGDPFCKICGESVIDEQGVWEDHLINTHGYYIVPSKASELFGQNDPSEILGGTFGTPEDTANDLYNMTSHDYSIQEYDKWDNKIIDMIGQGEPQFDPSSLDSWLRSNGVYNNDLIYDLVREWGKGTRKVGESKASEGEESLTMEKAWKEWKTGYETSKDSWLLFAKNYYPPLTQSEIEWGWKYGDGVESLASEYSIKEEFDLQDQDGKYEMLSKADLSVADATNYSTYSHSELPEEVKDSLKGDEDSYGESWSRKSSIDKIEALERLGIKQGDAIKLSGVEFEDFGEDLQGALKGDVEDARNRMKAQKAFLNKTEDDQNPTGFNNQVGGEVDNPNSEFGQNYPDYNKIGESQTSMTKYECEHCNLGFKSNESLSRHHKSIHKIASEDIDGYSVDAGFTGQNSFTDMSSISKEDVTQEWWNNVATPSSKARILNNTGTPVENTFGLPSYYELTQETKAYLLGLDDFSFESKATEDAMPFDPYTNDYHKGWQSFNMDVGADGMIKHSHPSAASNINMAHRQFDANPTEWNDFHNQFEDVYEPSPVGVTKDDFWTNQEIENTKGLISGINPLNESKASEGQFDPNVADLWDESDMSERLKILSSLGITVDFDMAINGWSNLPLDVQITLEEINVAELRGESKANENKTYTCDKCGKVGDSFTDMAQEECPEDVNANHQIPIFGDQVKPRGIGESKASEFTSDDRLSDIWNNMDTNQKSDVLEYFEDSDEFVGNNVDNDFYSIVRKLGIASDKFKEDVEEFEWMVNESKASESRIDELHGELVDNDLPSYMDGGGWIWKCDYCSGFPLGAEFGSDQIRLIKDHLKSSHGITETKKGWHLKNVGGREVPEKDFIDAEGNLVGNYGSPSYEGREAKLKAGYAQCPHCSTQMSRLDWLQDHIKTSHPTKASEAGSWDNWRCHNCGEIIPKGQAGKHKDETGHSDITKFKEGDPNDFITWESKASEAQIQCKECGGKGVTNWLGEDEMRCSVCAGTGVVDSEWEDSMDNEEYVYDAPIYIGTNKSWNESKASEGSEDVYNYEYVDDKVVCKNCGMKFDNAIDDARAMKDHSEIHESLYDKEAYAHEDDLDTLMWDNENPDDKGKQWKDKKGKKQESKASESILAGRSIEEYLQEYGMTREEGEQVAEYAGMDLKELIEIGNFDEARHHRVQDMDVSYMYEESKASEDITFADQHRGIQKDMIEFIRRKGGSASELDIDREFDLLNNFDNESRHLQALVNDGTLTSGGWQPDNSGNDGYPDGSYIYNLNESYSSERLVEMGSTNGVPWFREQEPDQYYDDVPMNVTCWNCNQGISKGEPAIFNPTAGGFRHPYHDADFNFGSNESKASEAGLDDHSCPECGFITSDNSDYVDHLNAHED